MEAATPAPPPPPPPVSAETAYPVTADADHQPEYSRFLPLVKWILAIPHYLVLIVLFIGALFAHLIAFFAVLFTRRYPRGLFDYVTGVFRWAWNVYAYVYLLTDRYPPFALAADPTYPARFEVTYPEDGIDRWRPLVQWLLVIPFAIVAGLLTQVAGVVALIGVFVILFTKDLPQGMFNLILIPNRWYIRSMTYSGFLVDRYPPFSWEE